jgi:hypothetical protein
MKWDKCSYPPLCMWHAFRPRDVGRTRAVDGLASVLVTEHHEGTKPALGGCSLRYIVWLLYNPPLCEWRAFHLGLAGLARADRWIWS